MFGISYSVIIYVIAISLQISGALLLTVFLISTKRDKVIERFAGKGIITKDNNLNKLNYNREKFRDSFKEAYLNKLAFVFIVIGYILGIFGKVDNAEKVMVPIEFIVTILVCISTFIFMGLAYSIVKIIVENSKKVNKEITPEELEKLGIKSDIENISNESIDNL